MRMAIFQNMEFGGAMRASHEIARGLAARGHELQLFRYEFDERRRDLYGVPKESENPLKFSEYATIHELPDPRPRHRGSPSVLGWRVHKGVKTVQQLCDLTAFERRAREDAGTIDRLGCDAVLVHLCRFTNAPFLLRHLRTPAFWFCQEPTRTLFETADELTDQGVGFCDRLYRRRRRSAEVVSARAAGTILCNSEFSREFIYRSYARDAVVCRLGVDTETFVAGSREPAKNQVICWGPLWPLKGLDFIIRSVARIPEPLRPDVVFPWTRGSETYRRNLETLSQEARVILDMPRGLSDGDLLNRIHDSKVCVYAAKMEPLGLVPLEAMAAGLPVVGVREGGVRESVLHGVTGFLCGRNEHEFATNLSHLLQDDDIRNRMARDAAAYVRREWTWGKAVAALEILLADRSRVGTNN